MNNINITDEDISGILDGNVPDNTSVGNRHIINDAETDNTPACGSGESNETLNDIDIKVVSDYGVEALMTQRVKGAPWFDACHNMDVTVIGAGGISSWTLLALSRLNLRKVDIYDDDIVSLYNMAGQFYTPGNVGAPKVYEIIDNIRQFSPMFHGNAHSARFYIDTNVRSDIVISGVDSMRSRQEIYDRLRDNGYNGLYIDGRLSADTMQVICFRFGDYDNMQRYEKNYLFSDFEADPTVCSFKQTTYMAMMIASVICNIVVNHANNIVNLVEYNIPFFTEYNAMKMSMEVIR